MISPRLASLKPLLESKDGLHLTAYITVDPDPRETGRRILSALDTARIFIDPVLAPDEASRFLEPLRSLAGDEGVLERLNGNLGLFRKKDSFRILSVPVEVDDICVVATSFHIKPLLRWMQVDREFLLLGLDEDSAYLYHGNLHSLRYIDAVFFPEPLAAALGGDGFENDDGMRDLGEEAVEWVSEWIAQTTRLSRPRLFVAGTKRRTDALLRAMRYPNLHGEAISGEFAPSGTAELAREIRAKLRNEARSTLENALMEYNVAEDLNLGRKNLFQVAKAVVQGRVRKLIVAEGIEIFGKINPRTGGLAIHPGDIDHEDDDVLDDLAQRVLSHGGEVVVARREEIPKGRTVLAILDPGTSPPFVMGATIPLQIEEGYLNQKRGS